MSLKLPVIVDKWSVNSLEMACEQIVCMIVWGVQKLFTVIFIYSLISLENECDQSITNSMSSVCKLHVSNYTM